ncbi:hypothetical protein EDD11_001710 [Mortierella claussenii]|nr:hypothetical protein EDD11_001710 [Mortierella claussenii]
MHRVPPRATSSKPMTDSQMHVLQLAHTIPYQASLPHLPPTLSTIRQTRSSVSDQSSQRLAQGRLGNSKQQDGSRGNYDSGRLGDDLGIAGDFEPDVVDEEDEQDDENDEDYVVDGNTERAAIRPHTESKHSRRQTDLSKSNTGCNSKSTPESRMQSIMSGDSVAGQEIKIIYRYHFEDEKNDVFAAKAPEHEELDALDYRNIPLGAPDAMGPPPRLLPQFSHGYSGYPGLSEKDYSPNHPIVRKAIKAQYQDLRVNRGESDQVLIDRLIQDHLPYFWRLREQQFGGHQIHQKGNLPEADTSDIVDDDHGKDHQDSGQTDIQTQNRRPKVKATLTTCVECGFLLHKQLLYEQPALDRQLGREDLAARRTKGESAPEKRALWRERGELMTQALFERRGDPTADGRAFGAADNSYFSMEDIDNVLNNNLRAKGYDGNVDHIGLKQEGHGDITKWAGKNSGIHHSGTEFGPERCGKGRKLHIGWQIVLGYDHSSLPCGPAAATSPSFVNGTVNSRPPVFNTVHPQVSVALTGRVSYPARSLMAAFTHILPNDCIFTQNQLRKLFTYFLWHPWFDTDLQAITIRSAYEPLWPMFVLRDEDDKPELKTGQRRGALARGNQMRKEGKGDDEDMETRRPSSKNKKVKIVNINLTKLFQGWAFQLRAAKDDSAERRRLLMVEQRFTTAFNNSLRRHGVDVGRRLLEKLEPLRLQQQRERGWLFKPSDHIDLNGQMILPKGFIPTVDQARAIKDTVPRINTMRRIFIYSLPSIGDSKTQTVVADDALNRAFTQPSAPDALLRLQRRFRQLARRARERRQAQGFIVPEYMVHKEGGDDEVVVKEEAKDKTSKKGKRVKIGTQEMPEETRSDTTYGYIEDDYLRPTKKRKVTASFNKKCRRKRQHHDVQSRATHMPAVSLVQQVPSTIAGTAMSALVSSFGHGRGTNMRQSAPAINHPSYHLPLIGRQSQNYHIPPTDTSAISHYAPMGFESGQLQNYDEIFHLPGTFSASSASSLMQGQVEPLLQGQIQSHHQCSLANQQQFQGQGEQPQCQGEQDGPPHLMVDFGQEYDVSASGDSMSDQYLTLDPIAMNHLTSGTCMPSMPSFSAIELSLALYQQSMLAEYGQHLQVDSGEGKMAGVRKSYQDPPSRPSSAKWPHIAVNAAPHATDNDEEAEKDMMSSSNHISDAVLESFSHDFSDFEYGTGAHWEL